MLIIFLVKEAQSFFNKYSDIMYNRDDVILLKKFTDKKIRFLYVLLEQVTLLVAETGVKID